MCIRDSLCIYNAGTRSGTIAALAEMRRYLEPDEAELLARTDAVLEKRRAMPEEAYVQLELYPDFDE